MRYTHSLGILPPARGDRRALPGDLRGEGLARPDPRHARDVAGHDAALRPLLDPGDEVVLSDPYYACYPNFIRYADGVPVYVDTTEEDGFQYRPEAIQIAAGAPHAGDHDQLAGQSHRRGAVPRADGRRSPRWPASDGPWIVADEIYHGLTDGGRDRSILEFTDRAFVLNGFSKAFAMTGWRLGWRDRAAPAHRAPLQRLYGNFFISTNEFVQWAGVAALREATDEDGRASAAIFDERRRRR